MYICGVKVCLCVFVFVCLLGIQAEVLNAFFISVLIVKTILQKSKDSEIKQKVRSKEYLPLVEEDQVREYLRKLDIQNSMGSNEMHLQVLRELADAVVRPFSITFKQSW